MSLAMRPNEVNTEVQYDCKVRHQAVIFLYTEVQNMRKNMTEIVFILDRSGSMSGLETDTIGGFNSMIEKQKKENGEALISTVLFDNVSEVIHDRVPVQKVEPMTDRDYSVRGCTALLDAIGGAIHHIGNVHKYARNEDVPEHTLFVITTDGMENASRRYDSETVKKMIERQKEKYGWEFLFLGANIDAVETAKHFGVKPHSVEHALRTLIGTCWAHGDRDALNEIAGRVLTHAPSNAEFIDMIAAYIKNGGRHENPMERLAHRRLFACDK